MTPIQRLRRLLFLTKKIKMRDQYNHYTDLLHDAICDPKLRADGFIYSTVACGTPPYPHEWNEIQKFFNFSNTYTMNVIFGATRPDHKQRLIRDEIRRQKKEL